MTAPAWLWRHLEQTGTLGPDRIGRGVRATLCPRCKAATLTGLDGDLCAAVARVDPGPLDPVGEALAQLTGRATYALHKTAGRYELQFRDHWQIGGTPAGTGRVDILAEHRCGAVLPHIESRYAKSGRVALSRPPY